MRRERILKVCPVLAAWLMGVSASAVAQVKTATGISEVFGDGAKVTTAILQYESPIDGNSLSTAAFQAAGREVTAVYASQTADKGAKTASGNYVVVELKSETVLQPVRPEETQRKIQGPVAGQKGMGGGPRAGMPGGDKGRISDTVSITQVLPIRTAEGKEIVASQIPVVAKSTRTLVADDFKQLSFADGQTGIDLQYNLFVPKDLEPGKRYPLVLFIHDASGAGKSVKNPLLQGNGATVWATPESQAKHPCFVLAPQFAQVTVDDDFNTTPDLDACLRLVDSLLKQYPIDVDRVYTTGQSMGCMSSYVLMLRRPELFASAMLVAGQWDPTVLAPLAKKNLWLLSCKGDVKSSEGVAQAIEVWKKNGAMVVEQEWPLDTTAEARAAEVKDMLRRGGNIHYTHFAGGSHNNTWRKAYYIDGVRDWLFAQHRPLTADSLVNLLRNVNDTTVRVIANHGDFHGTTENSIQAIEKAVQKGAEMALVDVKEEGGTLLLGSGEKLSDALDSVGNTILLLVNPASAAVAKTLEQWSNEHKVGNQFVLYGSAYGTKLHYMARVNLDKDAARLSEVLATRPLAVELNFSNDADPQLAEAVQRIRIQSRVCFNITAPGLSGSRSDADRSRSGQQQLWMDLIQKGGTLLLTNQIKPLLNWRSGLE